MDGLALGVQARPLGTGRCQHRRKHEQHFSAQLIYIVRNWSVQKSAKGSRLARAAGQAAVQGAVWPYWMSF